MRQYEGGQAEWDAVRTEMVGKKEALERTVGPVMERIERAHAGMEEARRVAEGVGGQLLLVDLAGADHDNRDLGAGTTAQQRKESTDINKSLLALKECFRTVAGVYGGKVGKKPARFYLFQKIHSSSC